MKRERIDKVTLDIVLGGVVKGSSSFPLKQAERILSKKNNGGWQLPKDSKLIYNEQNGIITSRNTGENKG